MAGMAAKIHLIDDPELKKAISRVGFAEILAAA
jgi:hypothetical protein